MATENRTWGYTRIQGAMANLGYDLKNSLVRPEFSPLPTEGAIKCRKHLGGLLRYHYRDAA